MGWCSGTHIFDLMTVGILSAKIDDKQKVGLLVTLIDALWSEDWDCESDSRYIKEPLVMTAFKRMAPEFYDDD